MTEKQPLTTNHLYNDERKRLEKLKVEYRLEILNEQKILAEKLQEREQSQARGLAYPSIDQLKEMHPDGQPRTETQVLALAEQRANERIAQEYKQRQVFEKYEREHGERHPLAPEKPTERDIQAEKPPSRSMKRSPRKERSRKSTPRKRSAGRDRGDDFGHEIDRD